MWERKGSGKVFWHTGQRHWLNSYTSWHTGQRHWLNSYTSWHTGQRHWLNSYTSWHTGQRHWLNSYTSWHTGQRHWLNSYTSWHTGQRHWLNSYTSLTPTLTLNFGTAKCININFQQRHETERLKIDTELENKLAVKILKLGHQKFYSLPDL